MAEETLGLLLVRGGLVTREQLSEGLRLQKENGRLLGTCLVNLGYVSPPQLLQVLSRQLGVPALPPGALVHASPEAIGLVPAEMAMRLRVIPYSWDGNILGVAVSDGRVLEHLTEVAVAAQAAVGAYLALEMEVEATLGRLYGRDHDALREPAEILPGRPRPERVQVEVPDREFGAALGLDEPVVLKTKKVAPTGPPPPARSAPPPAAPSAPRGAPPPAAPSAPQGAPPPAAPSAPQGAPPPAAPSAPPHAPPPAARSVTPAAPPPAAPAPPTAVPEPPSSPPRPPGLAQRPPAGPPGQLLERLALYDAVEQVYEAKGVGDVGTLVGRALLNYFSRVLVLAWSADGRRLEVLGRAGFVPERAVVASEALEEVRAVGPRALTYGTPELDPRIGELGDLFGLEPGAVCLVAGVEGQARPQLMALADNGDNNEPYEDLHDVEMLVKEAETAMNIILARPIPIPTLP